MRGIAALVCALSLSCGTSSARAEAVVPVEGSWRAMTSAGLPISFEVKEGQVVDARFKFRWGFCGTFESALGQSTTIDAAGHWKYLDSRGPWIEGTFLAADRVEGKVVAPSRMLPGCPQTEATFTAMPGEPLPEPEVRVKDNISSEHLAKRPPKMILSADGSFYLYAIKWKSFGGPVARATAVAYTRAGCMTCPGREVAHPRVKLWLTDLTLSGEYRVYGRIQYVLLGPRPAGFTHRGSLSLR